MNTNDLDVTAAQYVLGLIRGPDREIVESRLERDAALLARVERWGDNLAPLDVEQAEELPAGVLDDVLAEIDADDTRLAGTVTQRAGSGIWLPLSQGVSYRILRDDHDIKRRSMLIRMEPGAIYQSHHHDDGDEECLVIEGDLSFGELTLRSGDFHVAQKGMIHPVSRSRNGCLLHITSALH